MAAVIADETPRLAAHPVPLPESSLREAPVVHVRAAEDLREPGL